MQFSRKQVVMIMAAGFFVVVLFLMLFGVIPGFRSSDVEVYKANLNVWVVSRNASEFSGAVKKFKEVYPGVTFNFRNFSSEEEYERTLIDALAAGQGPDVFTVPNESIYEYRNKILPLSPQQFPLLQLRQYFPQVVEDEMFTSDGLYGLPVSIDTLALVYNRDLLDQEGIVAPPKTWREFETAALKLTKRNESGEMTQSGAAIGGSGRNVINADDIVYLLMLQKGVSMMDSGVQRASFASPEGVAAFDFYTHFAKRGGSSQVWDESFPDSFDLFASEKVAMVFAYRSDLSEIEKKNAFIDYGVADVPQEDNSLKVVSYPRYKVFAVSKQSREAAAAWSFVFTLALYPESTLPYFEATKEISALRQVLPRFESDPVLSVYARQILTARSWLRISPKVITEIIDKAIQEVVTKNEKADQALYRAQTSVTQLMQSRLR